MKYNIYFLHGFLGQAQDFCRTIQLLESSEHEINCISHSLLAPETSEKFSSNLTLKKWVSNFNEYVKSQSRANEKNILIGYSMGGRLALHLAFAQESLWSHVFSLSSHPGFLSLAESESRKIWQKEWQEKLTHLCWTDFIAEWNSQEIFAEDSLGRHPLEERFSKESLSNALINWSPTEHYLSKNFLTHPKVTWVVGNRDKKYFSLYSKLKESQPAFNFKVFSSGHRTFENTDEIIKLLGSEVFTKEPKVPANRSEI